MEFIKAFLIVYGVMSIIFTTFFLINLFAFHTIFRGLAVQSSAGAWLVSIFFGAIATYILKLTAIGDQSSS